MISKIKQYLQDGVSKNDFPGASFCIVTKDEIICDYVGYLQTHPNRIENKIDTIYDCASLTKVVTTTTLIMHLIEHKILGLNTKISSILPRFRHDDITVYHMLTHTSGLPADIKNANTLRNEKQVLNIIYSMELINKVGDKIVYSDVGFILLGKVIEELTSMKLNEYAQKVIYEPLNMTNTSFTPIKEHCAPTEYRDDLIYTGFLQGKVHDEKSFALNGISGHAGMFSTSYDLALFIQSILKENFVLTKETTDSLFKVQKEGMSQNGNKLIRSLGWNKPTKGGTAGDNVSLDNTILHTGFTGCNMFIEREKGIGFVMLSNAVHPKRELNNIIYYRNKIGNIIIPKKENES